jgi:hypothetical protein
MEHLTLPTRGALFLGGAMVLLASLWTGLTTGWNTYAMAEAGAKATPKAFEGVTLFFVQIPQSITKSIQDSLRH